MVSTHSTRRPAAARARKGSAAVLLLLVAVLGAACENEGLRDALLGDAATSGTVLSAVSRVQTDAGQPATAVPGPLTPGTTAGYALSLTPSAPAVTNGGTASVTLTAATAFTHVQSGVQGLDGYFETVLPAATTSVTMQPTVDQDYRDPTIGFEFVVGDGTDFGPSAVQSFDVIIVGTGDVQVSLTFDQQDDVDLHVVDPNGDRVYFGNRNVASGGELDLDANPVCGDPHGNAENITWPEGSAPEGTYEVYVDLFASCFPSSVNYTLTISVVGNDPVLLNGTLAPADSSLGPQLITTFDVGAAPPP